MELNEFKALIKFDESPKLDTDMIKCSSCGMKMGIKKWARMATKDKIVCPVCKAEVAVGGTVKVAFKEPSRFKIESVTKGKASEETRPDGTKLIKEEVHVIVTPAAKKKQ